MSTEHPQGNLDDLWNASVDDTFQKPEPATKQRGVIGQFFAENWLWIVVPALLVVVGLVALAIYIESSGGNDDEPTPFTYTTN
ncbi:MAG: hypothetical protein H6834_17690 [Planctomycetes bacterium]|nr:hypothetical protein [Planctomycetota bacterium]